MTNTSVTSWPEAFVFMCVLCTDRVRVDVEIGQCMFSIK